MTEEVRTTRVFLVRHGRVADEWVDRIYGGLDVPLSSAGERESNAVAGVLADQPLAAVISSGLARAEYLAALLRRGRDLERQDEPSLREIDRGAWKGLTFAELEEREPRAWRRWLEDPGRRRAPGGESLDELTGRVLPCLERLVHEHAGRSIAVVAHGWVIRVAVCAALDLAPRTASRFHLPTGGLSVIDWPADAARESSLRPTLAGFDVDRPPDPGRSWFRGPHRG